ncbi:uncharacterized protein LOC122262343 isoform X2 [Penaeus japonicus]|uniref:uncharacterized protein LOC122262343 isoform X2 n=1 Tax=Penaeus japonicus TaxID=27405 RepID=UPI001C716D6D|nr:uncharacterized protein LOC122262343 isoform X2 [Penaeus japonicus]
MALVKARATWLLLLSPVFSFLPAAPFEIQRDCIVSSRIEQNDILFDTLEFLALIPGAQAEEIRGRVSCSDEAYHYIQWNSRRISATTSGTHGPFEAPRNNNGWTRFTLGFAGNLTLVDDRHQSWLPGNVPLECPVSSVEISGSSFAGMCPTSTPVWKVDGKASVEIPLQVDDEAPETLTLFSTTDFRPVFSVGDSEFHLGMSGENLMTGRHHAPLSRGAAHRLVLKTYKENDSTMFQVFSADLPIHTESLREVPKRVRVQSQSGSPFVLVQNLRPGGPGATGNAGTNVANKTSQCNEKDYIWWLLSMLVSVSTFFVILLVQHCRLFRSHKCGSPNRVHYQPVVTNADSTVPGNEITVTPAIPRTPDLRVLHLVSVSNAPLSPSCYARSLPYAPLSLPHISRSPPPSISQDEVYYEMTPVAEATPPPKSFDLETTDCVETINDVYQCAD